MIMMTITLNYVTDTVEFRGTISPKTVSMLKALVKSIQKNEDVQEKMKLSTAIGGVPIKMEPVTGEIQIDEDEKV